MPRLNNHDTHSSKPATTKNPTLNRWYLVHHVPLTNLWKAILLSSCIMVFKLYKQQSWAAKSNHINFKRWLCKKVEYNFSNKNKATDYLPVVQAECVLQLKQVSHLFWFQTPLHKGLHGKHCDEPSKKIRIWPFGKPLKFRLQVEAHEKKVLGCQTNYHDSLLSQK